MTKRKDRAVIEIQDTGIGILKEELAHMFSRFFRGKEAKLVDTEGMGIGLYMSKEIVESNGGRIMVESEGLNKGTKFTILLPIID